MQKLKILVFMLSFITVIANATDLSEEEKLLFIAIKDDKLDELKFLVETLKVPLNIKDEEGNTPLDIAMKLRKKEIISYLRGIKGKKEDKPIQEETLVEQAVKAIKAGNLVKLRSLFAQGLKITDRDTAGNSLIDLATMARKPAIKKYLMEKKQSYEQTQKLITPEARKLFQAIADNNLKEVKQLIESGEVSPNVLDHNKSNPLHYAVLFAIEHKDKDNKEMIAYLISKGTQNTYNALDYRPTSLARKLKMTDLLQFIEKELEKYKQKQADIKKQEKQKKEKQEKVAREKRLQEGKLVAKDLEDAIKKGEIEIVEGWLAQGGSIEQELEDESTSLLLAISEDQTEIAKFLIEKGASLEATDEDGYTPLLLAIKEENLDLTQLLAEKKANLEDTVGEGYTALFLAIKGGNLELVKLLVEKGADLEAKDNEENTPLLFAIKKENLDIIKELVNQKVDLKAKDEEELGIEELAKETGDEDIIEYVKELVKK